MVQAESAINSAGFIFICLIILLPGNVYKHNSNYTNRKYMKNAGKVFFPLLAAFILSCNSNSEKTVTDTSAAKTDTSASTETAFPVFTPFDVLEITHSVKSYANWKPAFDDDAAFRTQAGFSTMVLSRNMDDSNNVMIILRADDITKAKPFVANPRLKDIMTKGGVSSKPAFGEYKLLRFNPDAKSDKWVIITHKVKDFDAWLKVFDNEGPAARANEGLFDAILARGIDDPNLVQIIFDIQDKAKATAAITSEAKKKLMISAGVEGKPKIEFHQDAASFNTP